MRCDLVKTLLIVVLCCGMVPLFFSKGVLAETVPELLLVEVVVNGHHLDDFYDLGLSADDRLYLPVAAVLAASEIAVDAPDSQQLRVLIETTGERLEIDAAEKLVTVGTATRPLREGDIMFTGDAMLVSERLFTEAIGAEIRFDATTNQLQIRSLRPWPRDQRMARAKRWSRNGKDNMDASTTIPSLAIEKDYEMLGEAPQADIATTLGRDSTGGLAGSYNALVVTEAAYLTNRVYASGGDDEALANLRLTTGRTDPRGNVFGIPKLYDLRAGDVSGLGVPLVDAPSGRGLRLQASPLTNPTNFDQTEVEGDALPGWDAELYIGSILYDFQRIGADGRYKFKNIPLGYGSNAIKVVLSGPNGKTREETYSQTVGGNMLAPGEINAQAYLADSHTNLFNLSNQQESSGFSSTFKVDYGLMQRLTVGLFGARVPLTSLVQNDAAISAVTDLVAETKPTEDYAGFEVRPLIGDTAFESGMVFQQNSGGEAAYLHCALPFSFLPISIRQEWYSDLFLSSANLVDSSPLTMRTNVSTSIPFGMLWLGEQHVSLQAERRVGRDGSEHLELGPGFGHSLGPATFYHRISYDTDTPYDDGESYLATVSRKYKGTLAYRKDAFDLFGELSYRIDEPAAMESLTFTGRWRADDRRMLTASTSYSPGGGAGYGLSWSSTNDLLTWSTSVSYAAEGEVALATGLSFSFGYSADRGFNVAGRSRAENGSSVILLFEDVNGNGVFDTDIDHPLPNVGLAVNGRILEGKTSEDGRMFLDNLAETAPVKIEVQRDSLPDPFMVTTAPSFTVLPRPGQVIHVPIAVVESGEITGSLSRIGKNGQGKPRPLFGVAVQLLNAQGTIHAETKTLMDGTFEFNQAYIGKWFVRVAPSEEPAPDQLDTTPIEIVLNRENSSYHDLDLIFAVNGRLQPDLIGTLKTQRKNPKVSRLDTGGLGAPGAALCEQTPANHSADVAS
ncbi:MAG: hypothetical protein JZU50_09220 [Desulfobulbaceae bacterium]|nr:hypothetical protein [Desulfobulbaceae bacterium]